MKIGLILLIFGFAFVFSNSGLTKCISPINLDAKEVLAKTNQRYDSLTFYKSRGVTEYPKNSFGEKQVPIITNFEVKFEGSTKFEISWIDSDNYIQNNLFRDGNEIFLSVNGNLEKKYKDVGTALIDISSKEATARFDIAKILIPKEESQGVDFLSNLKNLQKLEDEVFDQNLCYKITGEVSAVASDGKAEFTFWIDKETFLIYRIDRLLILDKERSVSTLRVEKYHDIEIR